ncbi:MAG: bifunctional glutamate N-acetyltransferase/amino-acid acetyltransferase ArgJ [Limnochordia bacterium]
MAATELFEVVTGGGVTTPQGYQAAGVHCGLKRVRHDLAIILSAAPAACAGVFTTNLVKGAPVRWTQEVVRRGVAQAIVVNSGNANTCNGPQGLADATRMAHLTAEHNNLTPEQVIVGSTGVIGLPLDMTKIEAGIEMATKALSVDGGPEAALAILTTDTEPKEVALKLELSTGGICIGGMAKGSGMIHPNMATMLAFITTDAAVDHNTLQTLLRRSIDKSFNMLSVDGDTSTNDMVIVLANGSSGVAVTSDADLSLFEKGLTHVCVELTKMIARDGEGATKLIEIRVAGARTEADARKIARAISASNLVKTAIHGHDANWGRIFCAAGYSGADFSPDKVDIFLGDEQVAAQGMALPFDEDAAKAILAKDNVTITLDFHDGDAEAVAWTCDLTGEYVKINSSYRS